MKRQIGIYAIEFVCVCIFGVCGFFFVSRKGALLILFLGLILIAFHAIDIALRQKKLTALNDYLNRILSGEESMEIESMEEGELSILKTNLFKVMTLLMHQREYMKDEKTRLASAMADISHQLKTPLTSIMVMNELLEGETDDAKRSDLLKTQSEQLDKMNWLVQTLLKISKFDARCVELKREDTNVKDMIKKTIDPFLISMELKGIKLVNLTSEKPITCDINWTAEALQNILKNCIEHVKENDTITISDEETNLYTAVNITDMGCGIEPEDIDHVFERFYRGKNSSSDSVGIGLALSKTIIDEQKGEVSVQSKVGEGTSFKIKFYKTII